MKKLNIRKADKNDLLGIERVFESRKYNGQENWDWESARQYYDSFFDSRKSSQDQVFVGILERKVVGVIGYHTRTSEGRGICWLGWFYTHTDFGKRGFGQRLLEHVVNELEKKQGAKELYVRTSSHIFYNPALIRYLKNDFTIEKILKNHYEDGEHGVILCKRL